MDSKSRQIIASLAKMAWADGEVSDSERALLIKVFVEAGATEDDVEEFGALLENPESIAQGSDDLADAVVDEESRDNVMKALLIMSFMDGILSFSEMSLLEETQQALEISPDKLEELRQEALVTAKEIQPKMARDS